MNKIIINLTHGAHFLVKLLEVNFMGFFPNKILDFFGVLFWLFNEQFAEFYSVEILWDEILIRWLVCRDPTHDLDMETASWSTMSNRDFFHNPVPEGGAIRGKPSSPSQ